MRSPELLAQWRYFRDDGTLVALDNAMSRPPVLRRGRPR
jgi:hypothetical protein